MNKNIFFFVSVLLALNALIGCSSPARKTTLYTLQASPNAMGVSKKSFVGSVGVGPIVLPESLAHSEVVVLGANNQIIIDSGYLWAGDFKQAISRVMAADISNLTGNTDVWSFPWDVRTRPKTQVSLIVESFGGSLGGVVELRAKWKILSDEGHKVVSIGRCTFAQESANASYDAYVVAMNVVVSECSKVLVDGLISL